jgi:hypothetical protein
MRTPVRFDRRFDSPPSAVFAALQHAGLWHREDIPDAARDAGVRALEVTTRGANFKWKVYWSRSRGRYAPPSPQLLGRVMPDGPGTRVVAECRRSRFIFAMPALISLLFAPGALTHPSIGAFVVLGIVWLVPTLYYTSVGAEYEADAHFLLDRLDEILQAFDAPSLGSSRRPANER